MVPLSPSLLIASASSFVGIQQSPYTYLAELFRHAPPGADEEMWSLHFLQHVGARSHLNHRSRVSSWPLPSTRFVDELVAVAEKARVLHEAPRVGDVFALWSPAKKRYVRVGIIVETELTPMTGHDGRTGYQCLAIECTTREVAGEVTRGVVLRERRLSAAVGDRFIRWSEMRRGQLRFAEVA